MCSTTQWLLDIVILLLDNMDLRVGTLTTIPNFTGPLNASITYNKTESDFIQKAKNQTFSRIYSNRDWQAMVDQYGVHFLKYRFVLAAVFSVHALKNFQTRGDSPDQSITSTNLTVEIISVGNFYPTSISSFPYAGPGLDVGMIALRRMFGTSVTFKHTLLYDKSYKFCDDVTANVDYMTSAYFYQRDVVPNMTTFIAPGKYIYFMR